jgi:tetratricopeptide (TPR) repeat protein
MYINHLIIYIYIFIFKENYYAQKENKEEDLEEDIEEIVNQLRKIKPGNKAIGHALETFERVYNYLPEHPWVLKFNRYFNSQVEAPSDFELAKRLYNSGLNSVVSGNYSESLEFFDQAIVSQVELLGAVVSSQNMDVANSFFEKAQVLRLGSNYLESLNFYMLFTAITHKYHNGEKNLFTTKGNYGVAEILRMQGVHEDAKYLYEKVHTTRIELFGIAFISF